MQIADCQGFVQINFHSTCVLSHWSIPTGLGGLGSFFSCCSTNKFLRMLMHVKCVVVSLYDVTKPLNIENSRSDGPQQRAISVDLNNLNS